jgi:hypothetical protein
MNFSFCSGYLVDFLFCLEFWCHYWLKWWNNHVFFFFLFCFLGRWFNPPGDEIIMGFFFLFCFLGRWFNPPEDQTALTTRNLRVPPFSFRFVHRDMASEKKMVLNDNVPVSLLTVRMIMQGKVSVCTLCQYWSVCWQFAW